MHRRAVAVAGARTCVKRGFSTAAPLREQTQGGAQRWLTALDGSPCLGCGRPAPLATRVDCPRSGFPLTCSPACAHTVVATKTDAVADFLAISQDLAYAQSERAKTLFGSVMTLAQRTRATDVPADWEQFLRLYTSDRQWLDDACALRLVSAAYTYVMTLAAFLPHLTPTPPPPPTDAVASTSAWSPLALHVIGARAEAMMPPPIWHELALLHPRTAYQVSLVGDHVPAPSKRQQQRQRQQQQQQLLQQDSPSTSPKPRVALALQAGLYHDLRHELSAPDAFVLFNPGVGHPHLRALWRPTLEPLLASGRPALLTAFSARDQARDLAALQGLAHAQGHTLRFHVAPQLNPFRSLYAQLDPSDALAPIHTNRYVAVVEGVRA